MLNLAPNNHSTTHEIDQQRITTDKPTNKPVRLVCQLKQARWGEVSYLSIFVHKEPCLFSRQEHFF
jgi:hypothetical protein